MKKTAAIITVLLITLSCLSACGTSGVGADVDLSGFYDGVAEDYALPDAMEITEGTLKSYYPGLESVTLTQSIVRIPKISAAVCEFVFVQCSEPGDAAAVAEILQARVDSQVAGGAWYPASIKAWEKARVVTNGAYVAMIAGGDDTEGIVARWEALFK